MIVLIILDGWGISEKVEGNAIRQARTPHYDRLLSQYPHSELGASGEDVGLPDNIMGNSEVGHMNLGAGRIVYQDFTRINRAIRDETFFKEKKLLKAIENVKNNNATLHVMGLVSDGGVHSHIEHLFALLKLAKENEVETVVHPFLDGRDVLPTSAGVYLQQLTEKLRALHIGEIGTLMGRYYAMDRDDRWGRTQKAYEALTGVNGLRAESAEKALQDSYARGETDEFVRPTIITDTISDNDSVVFFNFRPDRARQLTKAFVDDDFSHFNRKKLDIYFVCMTECEENIKAPVIYPPLSLKNTLGEVLSDNNLKQVRIAETEKFYHVTYFFNGGEMDAFSGEERILIRSPKVDTYDMQPEMAAEDVTKFAIEKINSHQYDVIIVNFANPDMVAHTGDLKAGIKAIEKVDECIGRIVEACNVDTTDTVVLITADHGNAEKMTADKDETDEHEEHCLARFTAHTSNPVPFIITKPCTVTNGILADVAPTILDLLSIEKPAEMDGQSLIKSTEK